jgi:hypothetical protein
VIGVYEYVYEYEPLIEAAFSYTYSYTRISPCCRMAAKERNTGSFFVTLAFFFGNSGRGA